LEKIDGIPFASVKDDVDAVISLPKFKTHNLTTITCAVKNVFGLVPGLYKVQCHKEAPNFKVFSAVIAKIYGIVKPCLSIVDGIVAMEGDGPSGGTPYRLGVVGASADAVAVDAVFSKIIGLDPWKVASTLEAYRLGLGQADVRAITVVGESLDAVTVRDFKVPKILALYRLPNKIIRGLLRCVPLMMGVDAKRCTMCRMCVTICPQQAIREIRGKLRVDFRKCILCLCCSEMCPVNAVYLRFLRRRRNHEM
jgi:ferredoxin